jgi:hypothetical protein
MEQNPSGEANSHSASKKIPRLLWDLKVYYRAHNSPPLVPILQTILNRKCVKHIFTYADFTTDLI